MRDVLLWTGSLLDAAALVAGGALLGLVLLFLRLVHVLREDRENPS